MLCAIAKNLEEEQLGEIQSLEEETGLTLVAFSCRSLDPEREERLHRIEAELGSPLQAEPAPISEGRLAADPPSRGGDWPLAGGGRGVRTGEPAGTAGSPPPAAARNRTPGDRGRRKAFPCRLPHGAPGECLHRQSDLLRPAAREGLVPLSVTTPDASSLAWLADPRTGLLAAKGAVARGSGLDGKDGATRSPNGRPQGARSLCLQETSPVCWGLGWPTKRLGALYSLTEKERAKGRNAT